MLKMLKAKKKGLVVISKKEENKFDILPSDTTLGENHFSKNWEVVGKTDEFKFYLQTIERKNKVSISVIIRYNEKRYNHKYGSLFEVYDSFEEVESFAINEGDLLTLKWGNVSAFKNIFPSISGLYTPACIFKVKYIKVHDGYNSYVLEIANVKDKPLVELNGFYYNIFDVMEKYTKEEKYIKYFANSICDKEKKFKIGDKLIYTSNQERTFLMQKLIKGDTVEVVAGPCNYYGLKKLGETNSFIMKIGIVEDSFKKVELSGEFDFSSLHLFPIIDKKDNTNDTWIDIDNLEKDDVVKYVCDKPTRNMDNDEIAKGDILRINKVIIGCGEELYRVYNSTLSFSFSKEDMCKYFKKYNTSNIKNGEKCILRNKKITNSGYIDKGSTFTVVNKIFSSSIKRIVLSLGNTDDGDIYTTSLYSFAKNYSLIPDIIELNGTYFANTIIYDSNNKHSLFGDVFKITKINYENDTVGAESRIGNLEFRFDDFKRLFSKCIPYNPKHYNYNIGDKYTLRTDVIVFDTYVWGIFGEVCTIAGREGSDIVFCNQEKRTHKFPIDKIDLYFTTQEENTDKKYELVFR